MNCEKCKNKKFVDRIYEVTICNYCINGSNFERITGNTITMKHLIQLTQKRPKNDYKTKGQKRHEYLYSY